MKIFLDTADLDEITKYNDMGLLDGISVIPISFKFISFSIPRLVTGIGVEKDDGEDILG